MAFTGVRFPGLLLPKNLNMEELKYEKIIFIKKGRMKFYACLYDCGMYTIDRITKGFGGIVTTFETLEELEKYAAENGYKKA